MLGLSASFARALESTNGLFPIEEGNVPHTRFSGRDVHKKKIAVAVAEEGHDGEALMAVARV